MLHVKKNKTEMSVADENVCPICWGEYKSVLKHIVRMKEHGDSKHTGWFIVKQIEDDRTNE